MGCKACQKPKVHYRKGLWSPEEDQKLRDFILRYGHGCWSAVPVKAGKTTVPSSACDDFAGEFTANFATAVRLNALHLCPASKPPCLLVAALVFFFFFQMHLDLREGEKGFFLFPTICKVLFSFRTIDEACLSFCVFSSNVPCLVSWILFWICLSCRAAA